MDMDMLGQGLPPGGQHCRNTNFRAELVGVTGKLLQGLGGSLEEQVIEVPLMHADQGIELMGQGEDDVKVGKW